MERFLSALITTTIQLPVILWIFFGISLYKLGFVSFNEIDSFIIFASMVYFSFFIAYGVKQVNKYRVLSYFLIPLSFFVMVLFENSWVAQLLLYFTYISFLGFHFRKEKFTLYLKDIQTQELKKLAKFDTKKDAKYFIKALVEDSLKKLSNSVDYENENELKAIYLSHKQTIYQINKKEFNEEKYLFIIISKLLDNKHLDMINGGFEKAKEQKILTLLEDIQECEVIEVYRLKEFIEIEYIHYGKRKHLSIKEQHYINPKEGMGNYFLLEQKPLENGYSVKEYNQETKTLYEKEYLKEPHCVMNDIYKIVKIFYLQKDDAFIKDTKLVIIYKNKQGLTNSYLISFIEEKIDIKKYENIFKFFTNILDDTHRTQLEYSYDDKYFHPKKSFDIYDTNVKSLVRKVVGDYELNFPCTTFGKNISFKFDSKKGISVFNLSLLSKEYQLLDKSVYTYLTKEQKEQLHNFLAIAQLYLNDLFVNKEFSNSLVLDTNEYLEHHQIIEELERDLEKSTYLKECFYTNAEQGHPATQLAFIYSNKDYKERKFLILKKTDYIDTRITLKYDNNIKEELKEIISL